MVQKALLTISACLTALALFSCSSSKHTTSNRLPGTWAAQPITIDGKNTDWPSPYPDYDEKAMIGYAVSNDKDNLYITVETGDLATQLKIVKNGLTLWIDKKGDKDEITAINFPIPKETKDKEEHRQDGARPGGGQGNAASQDKLRIMLEDRVKAGLNESNEYSLQGFKACNLQYPLLEKDSCGIMVRMDIDADNELIWEAVIPFKSFYFKNEITKADKGRPLSICIETSGSKRPAGQGQGGGSRGGARMGPAVGFGMGGMGMGMHMGGGGMRGGNRSNPNPNSNIMESLYKSTKTYKKFGLAFP